MPPLRNNLARRAVGRFLRDTVRITEAEWTGQGTVDPVTLAVSFPAAAELYEGPGSVRATASTLAIEDGGDRLEADEITVSIPATVDADIRPGCKVVVVDSEDWTLHGVDFEVRSVEPGGGLMTRRLQCRRLQSYPSVGGA